VFVLGVCQRGVYCPHLPGESSKRPGQKSTHPSCDNPSQIRVEHLRLVAHSPTKGEALHSTASTNTANFSYNISRFHKMRPVLQQSPAMRSPKRQKRRVASDWIYVVSRDKNARTGEKNYQMKTGRLFEPYQGEYWNIVGMPGDRISTPIGIFEHVSRPGFFGWTPVGE
jgi:hypothetical protein